MNKTWGTKSSNFYGRNKKNDEESDTDDDQDEVDEAKRLQAVKAQKMKRFMHQEQDVLVNEKEGKVGDQKEESSDNESSDDSEKGGKGRKIGDRLFDNKEAKKGGKLDMSTIQEYAKEMDSKMLNKLIEKESPELSPMLVELKDALHQLETQVTPAIELMNDSICPKNCR
jgi:hypothetical protein